MKQIESFLQLEKIINDYKHGKNRVYTNCFLLKDELERLILNGRLFSDCSTNVLQIICNEDSYYHLYFYASLEDPFFFSEYDKPLLSDMLCTTPMREKDAFAQRRLEESGFKLHTENKQFVIPIFEQLEKANIELDRLVRRAAANGYHLSPASKKDLTHICNLWEQNLDTYVFRHVEENEWEKAFSDQTIHCIKNSTGRICAARWYENTNKNSWEHHITVDKAYRGMGFAQILLMQQMIKAHSEGCNQVFCWIEKNNNASVRLHSPWGNFNNKLSKQYVKCTTN